MAFSNHGKAGSRFHPNGVKSTPWQTQKISRIGQHVQGVRRPPPHKEEVKCLKIGERAQTLTVKQPSRHQEAGGQWDVQENPWSRSSQAVGSHHQAPFGSDSLGRVDLRSERERKEQKNGQDTLRWDRQRSHRVGDPHGAGPAAPAPPPIAPPEAIAMDAARREVRRRAERDHRQGITEPPQREPGPRTEKGLRAEALARMRQEHGAGGGGGGGGGGGRGGGGSGARQLGPTDFAGCARLAGGGAAVGLQVRFDFNSLNLQNPDSETVRTLVSLHDDGTITPYTLTIAAEDLTEADHIAEVLRAMPVVGSVKTLRDFVPPDQDARLAALEEAQILLGPAVMFARPLAPPDDARRLAAVRVLETQARALFAATNDLAFSKLADALGRLLASDQAGPRAKQLEVLVAGDFVETIETLRDALEAERLTIETLPTELVARETGADGQVRVVVLPRDDLRDFAALGEFVRTVQGAFPDATGRPALEAGVGEIVVDAFRQAFATAAVAIFIILLLAFRSVVDAALVMIPLLLAAALTAAAMVVLAIPLNVANVIVLPLLTDCTSSGVSGNRPRSQMSTARRRRGQS